MENKEYLLITEDGYEVKEKEDVYVSLKDKNKEEALEYHNKMLLSKNSNLPLTEQLQKAEAEVKRLQSLIEEENKPKAGDWGRFWDDGHNHKIISKLINIYDDPYDIYETEIGYTFECFEKITNHELIKLLENESK